MSDDERIDAFFARLKADPNLAALAVIIAPYRAMSRDPAALVAVLDAVAEHWTASASPALTETKA
jgi:hypothetical protein